MNRPKTLEEAQQYRYGKWPGKPNGNAYSPDHCIKEIWYPPRWNHSHQCGRNNGYGPGGLYCWQHAKEFENES